MIYTHIETTSHHLKSLDNRSISIQLIIIKAGVFFMHSKYNSYLVYRFLSPLLLIIVQRFCCCCCHRRFDCCCCFDCVTLWLPYAVVNTHSLTGSRANICIWYVIVCDGARAHEYSHLLLLLHASASTAFYVSTCFCYEVCTMHDNEKKK